MDLPIVELKCPWPLVNVEEERGALIVRFHADGFQWPAVEEVGTILCNLVEEADGAPLVLDFGNVNHVTGVGLEKLTALNKKLLARGGRLAIKNVDAHLMKRLQLSDLCNEADILSAVQ
jgi:hypothetical protein